jgi:succinate dehydrogenase/fumarate reductase flavoprotein subunit
MAYSQQYLGRVFFITDQAGLDSIGGMPALKIPSGKESIDLITKHGGAVLSGSSLDALLEQLKETFGVDKENLRATIEEYNSAVNTEEKNAMGLQIPRMHNAFKIEKGPFYAVPANGSIGISYGGLQITTKAEVVSRTMEPIKRLYACPGAAGGIQHLPGYIRNLGTCGAFGYVAAKNAADFIMA